MARPAGEKTRAGGRWTEARYRSFITSLLRQGTRRWAPKTDVDRKATTKRGFRRCAECKEEVPVTAHKNGKKVKNTFIDHIDPIVDPEVGFTSWDDFIERLFCEEHNLQVLCGDCHEKKTLEERAIAAERRRKEKESK